MNAIKKPMPGGDQSKGYEGSPHIRIVQHVPKKCKRYCFHRFAVKAITVTAFLINIYSIMLMEFHPRYGLSLFGITFLYEIAFVKANGGF